MFISDQILLPDVDSVDLVTFNRLLLIILPKKGVFIFNEECLWDRDFDITSLYSSSYINNSGREFTSCQRVFFLSQMDHLRS